LSITFFVTVVSIFLSCNGNVGIYVPDTYSWFLENEKIDTKLKKVVNSAGYGFRVIPPHNEYSNTFKKALKRKPSFIIGSTLYEKDIRQLIEENNANDVPIILSGVGKGYRNKNIVGIAYNRQDSFEEAGILAAQINKHIGENSKKPVKSALLIIDRLQKQKKERDSFIKGYETIEEGTSLIIKSINSPGSKEEARTAINSLKTENIHLYAVMTLELNQYCMEQLVVEDGYFISENWYSEHPLNERVIFSIEAPRSPAVLKGLLELQLYKNIQQLDSNVKKGINEGGLTVDTVIEPGGAAENFAQILRKRGLLEK